MCFEAIKRSPALAVGLSVLTLGILPIGYLGYRIVQWISNTDAYLKVSNAFNNYCCCLSRRQNAEDSDDQIEELILPKTASESDSESETEKRPFSRKRKITVPTPVCRSPKAEKTPSFKIVPSPKHSKSDSESETEQPPLISFGKITSQPDRQSPISIKAPSPKIVLSPKHLKSDSESDLDSPVLKDSDPTTRDAYKLLKAARPIRPDPIDDDYWMDKPLTPPKPQKKLTPKQEARIFFGDEVYPLEKKIARLKACINAFKEKESSVQNEILRDIVLDIMTQFSWDQQEFYDVLKLYLSEDGIGDRTRSFESQFKIKCKERYTPGAALAHLSELLAIFEEDF